MEGGYLYYDDSTLSEVPLSDQFQCPVCDKILVTPEGLLEHIYEYHKRKKVLNISEHDKMLEEFLEELSRSEGKKSDARPPKPVVKPLKEPIFIDLTLSPSPPNSPRVAPVQPLRIDLVDLNEESAEQKRYKLDLNVDLNVPF